MEQGHDSSARSNDLSFDAETQRQSPTPASNPPVTEFEKLQRDRRLARNRRSARIRRAQKKRHTEELQRVVGELKAENERLERAGASLRQENQRLLSDVSILTSSITGGNQKLANFQLSNPSSQGIQPMVTILPFVVGRDSLPRAPISVANNHPWSTAAPICHHPIASPGQTPMVLNRPLLESLGSNSLQQLPFAMVRHRSDEFDNEGDSDSSDTLLAECFSTKSRTAVNYKR